MKKLLWAYRTTKRVPTSESPFWLAYSTEAVLPLEFLVALRRSMMMASSVNNMNDTLLNEDVLLLEELLNQVQLRLESYL